MHAHQKTLKGKWTEIKGELQKAWGKITDDEWEQTKGDMKSIRGLIQQKYGRDKNDQLNQIFSKYEKTRDQAAASVKAKLKS